MTTPGKRSTIVISTIVVVILVTIVGLIYVVPGIGSVLASVGPTTAAFFTALLAFVGVLIGQIVVVALSAGGRLFEYWSEQKRADEEQKKRPRGLKKSRNERPYVLKKLL